MLFIRTCSQSMFLCTFARSQLRSLSTTGRLISQADVSGTQTEAAPPPLSQSLPLMTSRKLEKVPPFIPAKQAWLETLSVSENKKLGIVDLHPSIFGVFPRVDILWKNIYWQRMYKHIDYTFRRRRSEMPGTNKKPWPQKGTGRARHGNRKSPLWHTGGKATGPRGPKSYFFMLSKNERVRGLQTALTVKYAQDNLHIVDSLDIPTDDPEYLQDLVESRGWGLSVLFIDDTDFMPRNITLATSKIKPYNLMPAYGLNVYSMLKHENLVLTLAALDKIENKMLQVLHGPEYRERKFSKVSS